MMRNDAYLQLLPCRELQGAAQGCTQDGPAAPIRPLEKPAGNRRYRGIPRISPAHYCPAPYEAGSSALSATPRSRAVQQFRDGRISRTHRHAGGRESPGTSSAGGWGSMSRRWPDGSGGHDSRGRSTSPSWRGFSGAILARTARRDSARHRAETRPPRSVAAPAIQVGKSQ